MSNWVFQVFVFRDGEFLGTEMAAGTSFVLGRDPSCAVVVQDEQASRRHFQVSVVGPDSVLQDLGSANGTFVNSARITGPVVISGRDDIRVGRHTFKIKGINQGAGAAPGFGHVETNVSGPQPVVPSQPPPPAAPAARAQTRAPMPQVASSPAPVPMSPKPVPRRGDVDLTEDEMVLPNRGARAPTASAVPQAPLAQPSFPPMQRGAPPPPPPASDPTVMLPPPNQADLMPVPVAPRAQAGQHAEQHRAAEPQHQAQAPGQPHAFHPVHDDDEDEHDDEPFFQFSLVDQVAREKRLAGTRPLAEVMLLEGDFIKSYGAVPAGARHKIQLPSPDGNKPGKKHVLVRGLKDGSAEMYPPAGMTGRVMVGGSAQDVATLAASGKIILRQGDGASLRLGDRSYFVRVTQAPAALTEVVKVMPDEAAGRRLDRKIAGISAGGSFGAHGLLALFMFVSSLLSPPTKVTQLEDEFAEIKMPEVQLEPPPEPEPEPPKEEPPPPPEPTPPKPQQKVPKARPTAKQPPTPTPEAPAPKPGILAALTKMPTSKNAGSQTVLAAVSNINAVKVPGGQTGFKVSALIGKGPSNSIQIGGAGGGVNTKGLTSILREGGAGVLGGKGTGPVRAAPTMALHRQATAQGELSREEIAKVINQHLGEIQFCYEKELLRQPGLQGKVVFEWTIKPDGRVLVVKTKVGQLPSAAATNCMSDKIKTWQFPKPRGNGVVVVTYPFVFKQSGF